MISLIVCSINSAILQQLKTNVAKTIGCEFEIIVVDNKQNEFSIFTAYNFGAFKARYEILCFVHEDIEFFSYNWGNVITHIFTTDKGVGLIGACGGIVKTELPTSWVDMPSKYYVSGLVEEKPLKIESSYNEYKEVVVIDGLFMATTKPIWKVFPFPKRDGFHGYDLYYSLGIGTFKKIVVVKGIKIIHHSRGSFSRKWFDVTLDVHKEFAESLPRSTATDKVMFSEIYALNAFKFIYHLHNSTLTFFKQAKLIKSYILLNRNINLKSKIKAIYYWTRLSRL